LILTAGSQARLEKLVKGERAEDQPVVVAPQWSCREVTSERAVEVFS
jgi:hypothetical protein